MHFKIKTNFEVGAYSKLGSDLYSNDEGFWVVDRSPQKVKGFEFSAEITPIKELALGASFTSFEGKKQLSDDSWGYMSEMSIPPSKLSTYINYKPVSNAYINLYYNHTGERNRFEKNAKGNYAEGEGMVKATNLFSLGAGYIVNNFTYTLGVENLFNTSYYTISSMTVARDKEYARGNGRYITLGLTYKF